MTQSKGRPYLQAGENGEVGVKKCRNLSVLKCEVGSEIWRTFFPAGLPLKYDAVPLLQVSSTPQVLLQHRASCEVHVLNSLG